MQRWGKRSLIVLSVLATTIGLTAIDPPAANAAATTRVTRTVQQVQQGAANACRNVGLADDCTLIDGRATGPAHMTAYENSWVHRALTLQRGLDDNVSLARSTIPHTHNSFNSSVYSPPTVTNQDPNQIYSMTDQLRMDIRAIEMDVHWVPSLYGSAKTGFNAVVLCHGQVQYRVHVGCSIDRPLRYGLAELRNWLNRPENANEVVLLYLENNLDGNKMAHDEVGAALKTQLGDLVARPPAGKPCAPLPTSVTPAELRAAGHHVIIVGNCGPGSWGTWVHERGNAANWVESGSGPGDDYPGIKTGCAAERKRTGAGHAIVRWYEDSTWLSAMVSGESDHLTATEASAMAKCGATLIGFDQLTPEDPRLAAIVWSWAKNAPVAPTGRAMCATSSADGHFHDQPCANTHSFACRLTPDTWKVTATTGSWRDGQARCKSEFPGSSFAVPANGWENSRLRAAAGNSAVWLNYADLGGRGNWTT